MNKLRKYIIPVVILLFLIVLFFYRDKSYTPAEREYINKIEKQRLEKDMEMKNDPDSPFNQDPNAHFAPLKYFDVDPEFIFKSKLFEYNPKDTIKIYGTKGEERKVVKYGYVTITYKEKKYNVNVYKGKTKKGQEYYSIWFTDKTTNKESYGVGRYLDFEKMDDSNYVYTIDFNLAYNPYCSYSAKYSCAVPTKEDYLNIAVEAGEKKFHD
jgi:uncharacterized protein (DUF1684 family)